MTSPAPGPSRISPHGHRRSRLLAAINALGRLLPGAGASLLSLDAAALEAQARRLTRLDDFGDGDFQTSLQLLLTSLENEANLNPIGRLCVRGDLLRLLANRLRLAADRRRYPAIATQDIRQPLFITGLPRSGTTFLHALLAQDPACRAPQVWEVMHPSPPPRTAAYATDPRISQTTRELWWLNLLMPDFDKVHLIHARLPQECIAIAAHAFLSYEFESMYEIPTYRSWHDVQDKVPAYLYHRRFLQHLQWRCPGTHWVLKAPSHTLALGALLHVYPDAGVIFTHRDPLKVLPSCTSFTEVLRLGFTDAVDRYALSRQIRQRWLDGAGLLVQAASNPPAGARPFFHVRYPDLVSDPLGVAQSIYRHFDRELTPAALAAMQAFLAAHPQYKKGAHRYSLEEFGLQAAAERPRFQFYTDHFHLEPEV